jgi:hypothetical protein
MDEIVWLVRSVEVMANVVTSEVFWDKSNASYPRLLVQKCYNRHGRYLIIEERDGRRRCGIILIPETAKVGHALAPSLGGQKDY